MKFPKTLGACVDLLYRLREERQAIQREAEKVEEKEKALREHVLNSFDKSAIEGARGKAATASISRQTVATVKDWDAFYAHILKSKSFDLLQKRVSDSAFRERLEAQETVPGVEPFIVVKLSVTKAK